MEAKQKSEGRLLLSTARERGLQKNKAAYGPQDEDRTNVHVDTGDDKNQLTEAVESCNLEMVQYLLDQNETDVNNGDIYGFTPLHYAAVQGHLPMFKTLFEHPATDTSVTDSFGRTLLMVAAEKSNTAIVQYLLNQNNIDVHKRDKHGYTALHHAAENDHSLTFSTMYLAVKRPVFTPNGRNPLMVAADIVYPRTPKDPLREDSRKEQAKHANNVSPSPVKHLIHKKESELKQKMQDNGLQLLSHKNNVSQSVQKTDVPIYHAVNDVINGVMPVADRKDAEVPHLSDQKGKNVNNCNTQDSS